MTNVIQIQKALNVPKNISVDSVLNIFKDKQQVIYGTVLTKQDYQSLLDYGNRDDLICVDVEQIAFELTDLCKAPDSQKLIAAIRPLDTPAGHALFNQSNTEFSLKGVFLKVESSAENRLCRLYAVLE